MKKYTSFFRIRFTNGLQYRAAALAGVATQFAWGFLYILMFSAFYRTTPSAAPMDFSALASYLWLQQAFLTLFMLWFVENDILESIRNGNVAYELCRPMNLYGMWYIKSLAYRTSRAVLRCFPILLVALFLPAPYGLSLPPDWFAAMLFLLSMLLALLVTCAMGMILYILTFYMMNPMGIRMLFATVGEFFTGAVVPLPFMPDKLRKVMEILPFGSMQNAPFRIYSGNLAGLEAIGTVLLQLFWLVVLAGLGFWLMDRALRRVVIQGG